MTPQKLHHVFHYSAEIAFSGHQNAEIELIQKCSLEPCVSRLGKIAFSGLKNEENLLKTKRSTLEQRVTRLGKNRIFMPPESRK